ncbi:type IV pilus assembly protein PilM [Legionella massiliensis]|uniref:Type IV pilus assembly protein PilM n=1 Tax=Legionella massiliensis TaxID=1034943 RepID=A0A078L3E7_9GAMM|nr:pilus assembly protein PilM [Legionella massiliensis]CDZ78649.1 type IV pilus assembly protein PilM [Legionella massiliensis]CEE14387.1 Competence protein A [Legionella massiliensis]
MLKWFRPKYCLFLGIDISPTSIKILEISYYKNQYCIENYAYVRLASDDSRAKIIATIKTLLSQLNSTVKTAAIAVPDVTVISKTIQLANSLNAIDVEKLSFLEANKYLAGNIYVDFSIIGPSEKNVAMMDVLLVAAKADKVDKRIELFREAGLDVKIVDVESYAIASVINRLSAEDKYRVVALTNIGFEILTVTVFDNEKIIYRQEEVFISENHEKELDSNRIKLHIKNQVELFFSTSSYDFIECIYLTGEVGELSFLVQEIQDQIGIPVKIANPFSELKISKNIKLNELKKIAPSLTLAFGLALRLAYEH